MQKYNLGGILLWTGNGVRPTGGDFINCLLEPDETKCKAAYLVCDDGGSCGECCPDISQGCDD